MNGEESVPSEKPLRFWSRQFKYPATAGQAAFDAFFGALLPLLCVTCDLVCGLGLFSPNGFLNGALQKYSMYCCSEIVIGIAALGYYLIFRRASGSLVGVLIAAGVFSFLLGLFLLPLSIFGLLILIGIFGFTPFITSFVFFRNVRRCWSQLLQPSSRKHSVIMTIIVAAVVLIIPAIPELWANRIIESYPSS